MRLDHGPPATWGQAGRHWLVARRNRATGELAYYRCYTPPGRAGRPGAGRGPALAGGGGLPGRQGADQHQVRRWRSWYRWATLAMLAHAFLVIAAQTERTCHPVPPELIGVTCNQVQHVFAALLDRPTGGLAHRLRWSVWRRRHQARARACHYRRQAARDP